MNIALLDYIFPFIIFFYGAIMTIVLHTPKLVKLGETRLSPHLWQQMKTHRILGMICLWVGFFWSLQNLWLN